MALQQTSAGDPYNDCRGMPVPVIVLLLVLAPDLIVPAVFGLRDIGAKTRNSRQSSCCSESCVAESSVAPPGLACFPLAPTANAVGCILAPLRGWESATLFHCDDGI